MGFILTRPGKKGRKRYYLQFSDADGTRRTKAAKGCTSEVQAKAMLNAIERRIMEGKVGVPQPEAPDPEAERRRTITVQELGEAFTERFTSPRIKNPADYRMEAKSVLSVRVYPALGARPAASITSLDVERLRDGLAEKYAPQSVTNTLNTLSKVYGWAKKELLIDCPSPVRGVEKHQSESEEPITSDKYLSKAEAPQLLAFAEDCARVGVASPEGLMLPVMIATALYTGCRKGELYGLRWPSIDFDRAQVEVGRSYDGRTKSKKTRHVPLHPTLARILRVWRDRPGRADGGLVFPVEERMGHAYETLGLGEMMQAAIGREPPKPWHALRHTFASHFVMNGGSILTLQKLLGHADIKTTMRYAHLSPDFMTAEVARLNFAAPAPVGVTDLGDARRKRLQDLIERDPEVLLAALDRVESAAAT